MTPTRTPGLSATDLAGLARMMAARLVPPCTILLSGEVGAGKTHFARAFIRARQGEAAEDVPSPTFTLVQTYADPRGTEIWHADLYRLSDPQEIDELGLSEAMESAICLIEWPDRLPAPPPGAVTLALAHNGDTRDLTVSGGPPDLPRTLAAAAFVAAAGWAEAEVHPLTGDASTRRYARLDRGETAILMDDPPPGSLPAYLAMTNWLRARNFHAPQVLAADKAQGFALLEDLGDALVARVLEDDPTLAPTLYAAITDLLADLHRHAPPPFVQPVDLAGLAALFVTEYPSGASAAAMPETLAQLAHTLGADRATVTSLRDFHAENLIWRGDGKRLGLLDFQDAVAAHPAYDLVSALQDARRDVAPDLEAAMIARYLTTTGLPDEEFRAAYALLGAQRALRILAVFARLARHGKPRYLKMMPRVWGHLQRNLVHPALAPLRATLAKVPAP